MSTEPASIVERWAAFHADNPQVYDELERLAMDLYQAGHRRIGVKMVWETMRYNFALKTLGDDGFKLNNDFHALYARELIARHSLFKGVIETRERKAA